MLKYNFLGYFVVDFSCYFFNCPVFRLAFPQLYHGNSFSRMLCTYRVIRLCATAYFGFKKQQSSPPSLEHVSFPLGELMLSLPCEMTYCSINFHFATLKHCITLNSNCCMHLRRRKFASFRNLNFSNLRRLSNQLIYYCNACLVRSTQSID